MKTADYDYDLPEELIAQTPAAEREAARMLVLDRKTGLVRHRGVREFPEYLNAGDALVINDTRVIPARIFGSKDGSGGRVEVLLLEEEQPGVWLAIYKAAGHAHVGGRFNLGRGRIRGEILERLEKGRVRMRLDSEAPLMDALEAEGVSPLPPYIRRPKGSPENGEELRALDRDRYQTVYARWSGSIAAPTAGLHLTRAMLDAIRARGVTVAPVTLHVGMGTFKPIESDDLDGHVMHDERYEVTPETADALNRVRRSGGRLVAVGTASARVLETAADDGGAIRSGSGRTRLFIRPPYRFKAVDALLTNFHLPRSTLLVMISTLAGRESVLKAYAEAVRERYRFFSYGDCMLIV